MDHPVALATFIVFMAGIIVLSFFAYLGAIFLAKAIADFMRRK